VVVVEKLLLLENQNQWIVINMKLRYSQLTEEQKEYICNGCGSKGAFVKVPNFMFLASCNHHDFLYYTGASEEDRKLADKSFYKWMREDIKVSGKRWYIKTYYKMWAFTYYKAVRVFGKKHFSYREKPMTLKQLQEEMKK